MHVVVLGAGVIGVSTAYYLTEQGHKVTVVDRANTVADGASGGNGGQLSYSFTDAMANPALLAKLPRLMAGFDPAFLIRPPLNAQLIRWGLAFLQQCTTDRSRQNTAAILQLALRSSKLMTELRSKTSLEFSFRRAGKLVMLGDTDMMREAETVCDFKRSFGCDAQVITMDRVIELEPAMSHMVNTYAGAVYSAGDEVGDALLFTSRLSEWLESNRDTEFRLNTGVRKLLTEGGKLVALETNNDTLRADAVVVCLGAWSGPFLQQLGIRTNIYPMRGYSVTLPGGEAPNSLSISDLKNKMVISRLGDNIRIAGFADFVGYSTAKDGERIQLLLDTARRIAPAIADYDTSSFCGWGGFRPMTPDSRPLIGPSSIKGVHLNTGHGMLGWTLACASGFDVAAGL